MLEHKLNKKVKINKVSLTVRKQTRSIKCQGCYFLKSKDSCLNFKCSANERTDKTDVYFSKSLF